jgi:hypothetical protein
MRRSYRGLGLVVLVVLVVAPLTLFAVLALFEDESSESIRLSLDGVHWQSHVDGALLESRESWDPGEVRSAIVYVKNAGPDPIDADVAVTARSDDILVRQGYLHLGAAVGRMPTVAFPVSTATNDVPVDDLGSGETVPVTLTARFSDHAPLGSSLDSEALWLRLRTGGTRTPEAGAPSLLDAAGAQLWLAPILLAVAAIVGVVVQARRRARVVARDE